MRPPFFRWLARCRAPLCWFSGHRWEFFDSGRNWDVTECEHCGSRRLTLIVAPSLPLDATQEALTRRFRGRVVRHVMRRPAPPFGPPPA